MTVSLADALQSDLLLAEYDDALITQAQKLYRQGFQAPYISSAQMAAVGENIRAASQLVQAQDTVRAWLTHQVAKLKAREERGERPRSWRLPCTVRGAASTLGDALLDCLASESYLPQPPPQGLDRLRALQRFWGRFYDLYRYEIAIHAVMQLSEPPCTPERRVEG